jgi:isoamylase
MFCAGDEFMNTQRGNNNPWNQDNETTWLDWDLLEKNRDIFRFFKGMIAFRKAHPSLARGRFWREDVSWYGVNGEVDLDYSSHSFAFCLHSGSQHDRDIYVMINAYWEVLNFQIQEGELGDWLRVVDTSLPSPLDLLEIGKEKSLESLNYQVKDRSVVVLLRKSPSSAGIENEQRNSTAWMWITHGGAGGGRTRARESPRRAGRVWRKGFGGVGGTRGYGG